MTQTNDYVTSIGLLICFIIAYYVRKDAYKRGMYGHAWAVGVFFFIIICLPLYFILRKPLPNEGLDKDEDIEEMQIDDQILVITPVVDGYKNWFDSKRTCEELNFRGFKDWRLPTKDELDLIYNVLHKKGHGGYTGAPYWSSTEDSNNSVWVQLFYDGQQKLEEKDNKCKIIAVRVG